MRVIFLDIDGVFNHIIAEWREGKLHHLGYEPPNRQTADGLSLQMEQDKVFIFNRLIDRRPEIRVVLSSAWRVNPRWREEMRANGFVFDFLDRTPRLGLHRWEDRPRGNEIKGWIDEWNAAHPEDRVDRYAIIDDSCDMRDDQMQHFFRTWGYEGLTQAIADMVEYHLTYDEPSDE